MSHYVSIRFLCLIMIQHISHFQVNKVGGLRYPVALCHVLYKKTFVDGCDVLAKMKVVCCGVGLDTGLSGGISVEPKQAIKHCT